MRGPQFPPLDELQRGIQRAKSCVHGISEIISSQKTLQKEQHRWLVQTTHSDFAMKTLNSVLYMLNQRFTTGGLKKLELESSQPFTIHLWHRWWRRRWWLFVLPGWPKGTPHWCAKMGRLNYKNAVKIGACTINQKKTFNDKKIWHDQQNEDIIYIIYIYIIYIYIYTYTYVYIYIYI